MQMPRGVPIGAGMAPSKTELGKFIRARRLELGFNQIQLNQLVPRSGRSNQLITALETGRRRFLDLDQLEELAKTLQVDPKELRRRMSVKPVSQTRTYLGKLIRSRRNEIGLSLLAFAEKMGMTHQQAKNLETKKSPTLQYGLVQKLASALELHPSVLTPFVGLIRKERKSKLGQLVCNRRKELGISTGALAEKLDVSHQFVNLIELGRVSLCESSETIARLADALNLDVAELESIKLSRRLRSPSPRSRL